MPLQPAPLLNFFVRLSRMTLLERCCWITKRPGSQARRDPHARRCRGVVRVRSLGQYQGPRRLPQADRAAKLKRFGIEQPATDFFFWVIEQIPQEA
jgi:hypothetical protein